MIKPGFGLLVLVLVLSADLECGKLKRLEGYWGWSLRLGVLLGNPFFSRGIVESIILACKAGAGVTFDWIRGCKICAGEIEWR